MFNKSKTIKIKFSDLVILVALLISISFCFLYQFGFKTVNIVYKITDYSELLTNTGNAPFEKLVDYGFVRLENGVSNTVLDGILFGDRQEKDSYLSLNIDGKTYIVVENNLLEVPHDAVIKDKKYIFSDLNTLKKGIKSIYGQTILPAIFDSVYFDKNTAIATKNGINSVYYNNEMVFESEKRVFICRDSNFVGLDDGLNVLYYDLSGDFSFEKPYRPSILDNFPDYVMLEFFGDVFSVRDTSRDLIGFMSNNSLLIEPMFKTVNFDGVSGSGNAFIDGKYVNYYIKIHNLGMAMVNLNQRGLENARILDFNDYGYAPFLDTTLRLYGVIDANFNVVVPPIFQTINEKILNSYVFVKELNAFFSIENGNYAKSVEKISIFDDFCVAFSNNSYTILDKYLNTLITCQFAFYSTHTNTLFVIYNSSLYIFKR